MSPAVTALLQQMPQTERRRCTDDVTRMEAQLQNEEVVGATRCGFPFGTMIVTPTRLIIVLQDGGIDVTNYSDVASFSLIEGKRKLLGGYSHTFLNTQMRNGQRFTGQTLDGGPWAIHTGRTILSAHENYSLKNG
jgi:hypothetical protein